MRIVFTCLVTTKGWVSGRSVRCYRSHFSCIPSFLRLFMMPWEDFSLKFLVALKLLLLFIRVVSILLRWKQRSCKTEGARSLIRNLFLRRTSEEQQHQDNRMRRRRERTNRRELIFLEDLLTKNHQPRDAWLDYDVADKDSQLSRHSRMTHFQARRQIVSRTVRRT